MEKWLAELGVVGNIYFWVAVVASLFMIVQIALMLFSLGGGGDIDVSVDSPDAPDSIDGDVSDTGIGIFTVKGVTAFFTLGAWVGLLFSQILPKELVFISILPAFVCGLLAMFFIALSMKAMYKLQTSGNVEKINLIGKKATVYVSILPKRSGRGKITLTAQGKYMELDAVTDEEEKLSLDEVVEIVEITNATAVVKRV